MTIDAATTLSPCQGGCEHGDWPWHDRALGLEDDLEFVIDVLEEAVDILDGIELDCERCLPPVDILQFVAEHNWRNPPLVHRLAEMVQLLAVAAREAHGARRDAK